MMNSHPQLVLLSTFASNMTNRIMVDFIQKYLVFDPTLRKKSRYPTVVSLLQLLIIIMPGITEPSSEGKEPLNHSMAHEAHYDYFSGRWSNGFVFPSTVAASPWIFCHTEVNDSHLIMKGKNSF